MKKILYTLVQCTWGLPQTLVGAVVFLYLIRHHHFCYHGAIATFWKNKTSASLGMFLFLSENYTSETLEKVTIHEYGHTIQSLILGPLYLPVIALPSMLWCYIPFFRSLREQRNISYYSFYTERSADILADRIFSNHDTTISL